MSAKDLPKLSRLVHHDGSFVIEADGCRFKCEIVVVKNDLILFGAYCPNCDTLNELFDLVERNGKCNCGYQFPGT